jgi:SynChlorMet cassette protein ScmC
MQLKERQSIGNKLIIQFMKNTKKVENDSDIENSLESVSNEDIFCSQFQSRWRGLAKFQINKECFHCFFKETDDSKLWILQLMEVATLIAAESQRRGGVLLHGALAELNGNGVILAGPGGGGKTTASQRLPFPWRSLCDDTTLIVPDGQKKFWVHPWPTWSKFLFGGTGGCWDVQRATPLRAIFLLSKTGDNGVQSIGTARATANLFNLSEEVSMPITRALSPDDLRKYRCQRFNNICKMVKTVPNYLLHLKTDNGFWKDVESKLD